MESRGERVTPVSPPQGRKVLRAGVRIVGEQFDPEPHPDVDYSDGSFGAMAAAFVSLGQQLGTYGARRVGHSSALEDAIKQQIAVMEKAAEENRQRQRLIEDRLPSWFEGTINRPSPESLPLRNDGKPKKPKQDEPFYVSKTKRKRR